jgi:hypothetical protein
MTLEEFARDVAQPLAGQKLTKAQIAEHIVLCFRRIGRAFLCDCELGGSERRVLERLLNTEQELALARRELRAFMSRLQAIVEDGQPDKV